MHLILITREDLLLPLSRLWARGQMLEIVQEDLRFTIAHTKQNQTLLTSSIQDQASLYGLMAKLRDLGVKLISVYYRG